MKIGIDISQIAHQGTGVARFTVGLINAILEFETQNKWIFFYSSLRKKIDPAIQNKIKSSGHTLILLPMPPSFLSLLWNNLHIVPIEWFTGRLDWFISSDWTEPPASCKKATIIHDLTFMRDPRSVHPHILEVQKKRIFWIKKESSQIFVDSQATKQDVVDLLLIPESKIQVLYPGVVIQKPTIRCIQETQKAFRIQKPFILSVGKQEPRKNLDRLINAFIQTNLPSYELLLAGPEGWGHKIPNSSSVRYLGYVSEAQLHALYHLCSFFVYPSLWEGFGYPVVEAMMHKKAVLTSANSSLEEIVKDTALLCDPKNTLSITEGIIILANNISLRNKYEERGFLRSQMFNWNQYYHSIIAYLYENNSG